MEPTKVFRVLVVDDTESSYVMIRSFLTRGTNKDHYEVDWEPLFETGLPAVLQQAHDVYLIDYHLSAQHTGVDIIRAATESGCRAPMILLTGQGDREIDLEAMNAGAVDYLDKGELKPATLDRAIRYANERTEKTNALIALAAMEERQRLARELHDAVSQTLFSASMIAESLPRLWDNIPPKAETRLLEINHLTRRALLEMRSLLLELRPQALVNTPLDELITQLTETFTSRTRLYVKLGVDADIHLHPDAQVAFYRIAQEALNNIAHHAQATEVTVRLRYVEGGVLLSVEDNGTGFDPAQVPANHFGVQIMPERIRELGGSFDLQTAPGQGTRIRAVLPRE
jgi:signal transduction histidine kinase